MDIVEQLRERAKNLNDFGPDAYEDADLDSKTADEIERLRGALKELLNVVPNFPSEGNVLIGMKERYKKALIEARAALKEKE